VHNHRHQQNRTKNDVLSKNITSLLDYLLQDYDANHHPGYESGKKDLIKNDMQFLKVIIKRLDGGLHIIQA